ncbi:hypothetical protein BD410DRAFT_755951 [Rickenella mellea]|uniref:DUF6699 domain-containing protein n=1 Tax=Rickenella mellea TaxID=50990 RepID=A0A4Y7PKE4_9AGAM|nr:hypothetical protein BD410DRAFT_755951 [Rickenella mellea]
MNDGLKWAPGTSYGPVLSPTDLYLLHPKLELHPILTHSLKSFHLVFNLASGQTGGFNADAVDRDLPFEAKDETATLPRVSELYIITRHSPWCTIVKNSRGVSLADICAALWKEYSDNVITEAEFTSLPPSHQERIKRTAASREAGTMGWGAHFGANAAANRCKRIDWLRDKVFFDGMEQDDEYAKKRLGFASPNIFLVALAQ